MKIEYLNVKRNLDQIVLFPFDSHAFPFQTGVRLKLHSFPHRLDHRPKVVVPLGKPGSVDSGNISFYGTVRKVKDEYWMWYLANDDGPEWHQKLCFAKSKDGENWVKPNLGLYAHNGNKNNNVCDFPINAHVQACVVFYDPDEKDRNKVFKLSFESPKYDKRMGVAFSPDGIHWREYENNPVGKVFFEQSGGLKRDGVYYVNGQGSTGHYSPKGARCMVTYCSKDFINWTPAGCMSFSRDPMPPKPTFYGGVNGPQVHLGAGVWDRGNVIIGIYGMWDGHPSNDRNLVCMNLGLIVSYDGLHYYEPVPDFPVVIAAEMKNKTKAAGRFPALIQGQGFENIGDKTVFWFGLWPEADSDGVRMAVWERDRIGHLEPFVHPKYDCFAITSEIESAGEPVKVSMNVEGLSEYSKVRVSVLDDNFNVIQGYSREECVELTADGLKVPVCWNNNDTINYNKPFRLRVDFEGIRPEDIKLYALYLEN